jgi:sugar phosphate isomerase/epimerase
MRLACAGRPHLTYCTNIHAGESWVEVRRNVETHVLAVKRRISPDQPFGVGLRLSARAAGGLAAPGEIDRFRSWLHEHGLYVFTINGFPHGAFHGCSVKERVYLPDWLESARVAYTISLARILGELLPDDPDVEGTISTVPGAFRPRVRSREDVDRIVENLIQSAAALHRIREDTGKVLSLALEPEPACWLETASEAAAFFEDHLFRRSAAARFAALTGAAPAASEAHLRRHLGVCLDTCHMAVEWEDARGALSALRAAGIRVGKIQLSAGLEASLRGGCVEQVMDALRPFAESVYLHQAVARGGDALHRYVDLPEAIAVAGEPGMAAEALRVHFHVPVFREDLGLFRSTQSYLREVLSSLVETPVSPQLEVETYTWDVLPEEHRREDVDDAIARELTWARERLSP